LEGEKEHKDIIPGKGQIIEKPSKEEEIKEKEEKPESIKDEEEPKISGKKQLKKMEPTLLKKETLKEKIKAHDIPKSPKRFDNEDDFVIAHEVVLIEGIDKENKDTQTKKESLKIYKEKVEILGETIKPEDKELIKEIEIKKPDIKEEIIKPQSSDEKKPLEEKLPSDKKPKEKEKEPSKKEQEIVKRKGPRGIIMKPTLLIKGREEDKSEKEESKIEIEKEKKSKLAIFSEIISVDPFDKIDQVTQTKSITLHIQKSKFSIIRDDSFESIKVSNKSTPSLEKEKAEEKDKDALEKPSKTSRTERKRRDRKSDGLINITPRKIQEKKNIILTPSLGEVNLEIEKVMD
jgi:hypothetical protein